MSRGEHEFYDFEAKYLDDATELTVPADLPAEVPGAVQALAVPPSTRWAARGWRAWTSSRPDGGLVVNEVNTIPGFTPVSMFPRMWAASGLDYPALVDRLVTTALAKRPGLR